MEIHNPPRNLDRIDEVWLFISSDETGEGLCAFSTQDGIMPMVSADMANVDRLRGLAKRMAKLAGKTIKLIKMSVREEVEEYGPC
jgi:hypothetical protein